MLQWLIFGVIPFFLFSGCGDLAPEMQDTRTVTLKMDFNQRSSSRSSQISESELSDYKTHFIMAQPSWEYLSSSYLYPKSLAEGLMDASSRKVTLEIPLNTQMKIFAFLFKENYSHYQLFSAKRDVGYYGESQPFSIGTNTNSLRLGIQLIPVSGTVTVTTDTTAPVLTEVYPVTTPTSNSTPDYTFSSTKDGTINYGGSCSSTTLIAYSGNNNIHFNALTDGTYSDCTITVKDYAGNVSNTLSVTTFTVDTTTTTTDTTAPVLTEVYPVTTPTIDNTPDYTFSSTKAGTITYGGSCSSSTTSAIFGNNTITLVSLSDGTYSDCTITVTDTDGNAINTLTITSFIIDSTDTDGDGVGNNSDTDDDNDGISDADELDYGSDPLDNSSLPINDRWSSSIKGENIVLSNYNLDASSQNTNFSWNSVYGEKSYAADDGGIYEWKIKVLSVDDENNDSWEMVIGVGVFTEGDETPYNENNFLSNQTKGFGYIQQDGKKTQGSGSLSFLSVYELNDNITVRLDLNYHRLSFYKNNGDISVSHFSLPSTSGKKYRLAASIGDDGD